MLQLLFEYYLSVNHKHLNKITFPCSPVPALFLKAYEISPQHSVLLLKAFPKRLHLTKLYTNTATKLMVLKSAAFPKRKRNKVR